MSGDSRARVCYLALLGSGSHRSTSAFSSCFKKIPLIALTFARGIKLKESRPTSLKIIYCDRHLLHCRRKKGITPLTDDLAVSLRGSPRIRCETYHIFRSSQRIHLCLQFGWVSWIAHTSQQATLNKSQYLLKTLEVQKISTCTRQRFGHVEKSTPVGRSSESPFGPC